MGKNNLPLLPFRLKTQYREYVWGGSRLRPEIVPTAEAWAIYETNMILDGQLAGKTLADAAAVFGSDLLGTKVTQRIGSRFPVLVKLLDCNQWLSLQVHPDDRQAEELEGKGQFGKTEAWYFLETKADAEILCGVKSGTSREALQSAVRQGTILDFTNRVKVSDGDHVLIPAGTIHALGPGLLVYEVQESSDITYRVFDWNRPASQGRTLHIEQSIQVINPDLQATIKKPVGKLDMAELLTCEYFTLEELQPTSDQIECDMDGETFHAVTVIQGNALLQGDGWNFPLKKFDSLIIPACSHQYTIVRQPDSAILRVSA
jgi:mannose-6-phosphate isomerase